MKNKRIFMAAVAAIVTASSLATVKFFNSDDREFTALELANIEALANNETPKAVYEIIPYDCTISGNGKIKLGDGSIISLSGDGSITLSGARDCKFNESAGYLCTPIMCTDIYQVVF